MWKRIAGGVVTVIIGGTVYSISQADVVNNFSNNTGLNQNEAQAYVNNIKESDLKSFSELGTSYINDGNEVSGTQIDCNNYSYAWVTPSLSCQQGKFQIQKIGRDEIALGNCYKALDSNLGDSGKTKINECISDIDLINADYNLPIVTSILDMKTVEESKKTNTYNKSVLQAALAK